jgi:hypothetical protein
VPGPTIGLPAELTARSGSQGRRIWIAGSAAALVLILAAVLAVVLSGSSAPSAASQFVKAYTSFHSQFARESATLNGHLQQAGDNLGDPAFFAATSDAKTLASLYHRYAASVAAISMPAAAKPGAARLIRVANAGQFLLSQAGDFFTKSGMQAILNEEWPFVTSELTKAENRVRKALGLTA